jgi:hypothetical protein
VKIFLFRILLAAAVTLVAFALASSAAAQPTEEDPAPAVPRPQQSLTGPSSSRQQELPDSSANDAQTQAALAFTGRVTNEHGQLVLRDPVTKMTYKLDDQSKAKRFVGKQVKVVGKLEMKSNIIHIESIEPLS